MDPMRDAAFPSTRTVPPLGPEDPVDALDEGALPGAVGSHQAHHLPSLDLQEYVFDGGLPVVAEGRRSVMASFTATTASSF